MLKGFYGEKSYHTFVKRPKNMINIFFTISLIQERQPGVVIQKSENQFSESPNPDTRVYSEGFCLFRFGENEVPPLPNPFFFKVENPFFTFLKCQPKR